MTERIEEKNMNDNNDAAFDKIIEMTGNDGPFQRRYNYLYNGAMVIFASMSFMNIILALNVPNHWCHIHGRLETNFSLEQWKNLTLPRYSKNTFSFICDK